MQCMNAAFFNMNFFIERASMEWNSTYYDLVPHKMDGSLSSIGIYQYVSNKDENGEMRLNKWSGRYPL